MVVVKTLIANLFFVFCIASLIAGCASNEVHTSKTIMLDSTLKIISKEYYSDNILDSTEIHYHDRLIERVVYFEDKNIKQYYFLPCDSGWLYSRFYNEDGSFKRDFGLPDFCIDLYKYGDPTKPIMKEDTIGFVFFAPSLPNTQTSIFVNIEDSLYPIPEKSKNINCVFTVLKYPLRAGLNENCFTMEFIDTNHVPYVRQDDCIKYVVQDR